MTLLITGASGFIGKKLTTALLQRGDSVHYFGRRRAESMDSRVAYWPWLHPERTLAPLDSVPRLDAIIHLAGEPVAQRWTDTTKKRIADSRIVGTRNLVTGIAHVTHKPRVLVSASAIGFYGNRGDEILTEASLAGSDFLAEVCQGWEREAMRAEQFGIRVVCVRIGIVLGRDGGALAQMLPAFRFGVAGRLGSGKQWMSWIHRDDLVRLLLWAAETKTIQGSVNGVAPEPVTNAAFTNALAAVLHRPAVLPLPAFALKIVFGEMATALLGSIRVIPAAAQSAGFEFQYPRVHSALGACNL